MTKFQNSRQVEQPVPAFGSWGVRTWNLFRLSNFGIRGFFVAPGRLVILGAVLTVLAGCGIGGARKHPLETKVRELEMERARLAGQLEQSQVQVEQLKAQIQALSALPKDKEQNPYKLRAVKITRYTGFYDKDGDGRREKLIVYLQPIDRDGNVFKAAGIVSVQLWDLSRPGGQALLGQWQVEPAELHKLWFDALMSTSYRLTFDAPASAETLAKPLTVQVTFTDYLTGQVFTEQYVIQPRAE
jgi:outer membrane murein-binding lipoprotein Lpp